MKLKLCFTLILGILSLSPVSFAMDQSPTQNENQIVESLLNQGIKQYNANDFNSAINYFVRVLLLDPLQATAQSYLVRISDNQQVSSPIKIQLVFFRDLIASINNSVKQILYYETKLSDLKNQHLLPPDSFDNSHTEFSLDQVGTDVSFDVANPLLTLNNMLRSQKTTLNKKLSVLTLLFSQTKEQYKMVSRGSFTPKNIVSSERMASSNKPLNTANLIKKSGEIVDLSLKLTEKDIQLRNAESKVTQTFEQMKDLESRFELTEKLIQQKQTALTNLEKDYTSLKVKTEEEQQNLNALVFQYEENLIEVNGIITIYKDKYIDALKNIKDQQRDVIKVETISNLNQLAATDLSAQLEERNSQLQETQSMLAIYQQNLKSTYQKFKKNEADALTLSEQLDLTQKNLFEREKAMKRAKENFEMLDNEISLLAQNLNQLKKTFGNDQAIPNEVKTKFQEINTQLSTLKDRFRNNQKDLNISASSLAIK